MQRKVTFAGVGVQKSGSGWLFRMLQQHPDICTARDPGMKEINFFNHYWQRGYAWYEGLFPNTTAEAVGEYSVLYALGSDVPERIKRYNPDMRLVVCLRDPVERAFSQHRYLVSVGLVPPRLYDFAKAWQENPSYERQSRYADMIERFLAQFAPEQLLVLSYDDIMADPRAALAALYAHVRVAADFVPTSVNRRYNEARRPRSPAVDKVRRVAFEVARATLPRSQVTRLRSSGIADQVRKWSGTPVNAQVVRPLDSRERVALQSLFEEDLRRLSALVGRDYSRWLS